MKSTKILVTPQEVQIASKNVLEQAGLYETAYTEMYNAADELVQANYTGIDAQTFRNQIEGFRDDLNKMKTLMTEYSDYLKTAATTYADTQDAITQQASKLAN